MSSSSLSTPSRMVPGDSIPFFGTGFKVAGTMEPTGMEFFDRSAFMFVRE